MNIWIGYVAYPVTTAVYLERALRQLATVTTIGPHFPEELITKWKLENMKLPLRDQMIPTTFTPDMAEILSAMPEAQQPDLYLWVESVGGHEPRNLSALRCPKACYLIDSHLNLEHHLAWCRQFDYVFTAQREYIPSFRQVNRNSYWLPLACDPDIHGGKSNRKQYDVGFVGALAFNPRRQQLLDKLGSEVNLYRARCFWHDMAEVFAASKIVFNTFARNDLNMRFFEALCSGSMLLSDLAYGSGQDELFRDGEEYARYHDSTLIETAKFYLDNDDLREQIAARGCRIVHNAHTYLHRMKDMLAVVSGSKPETCSATELRERSLVGVEPLFARKLATYINVSDQSRSFVIPVLDYSPASEFNISTLLQDLEQIPGDVIVVFNNPAVAEDLKGHPRITRSAVMSENIGVARAWNVGVSMATTPNVFILNADLHVEAAAIDTMENSLDTLEKAACVGPQGSFVNHALTRDYLYFDKGSFHEPVEVDAVSGFLFVVKRRLFGPGALKFEEAFTPCYFEEWDMGLQIRQLGMKSWITPTTAYTHHWSGSIAARREIECLGRSETAGEILKKNRLLFLAKWREQTLRHPEALNSRLTSYARQFLFASLQSGSATTSTAAHQFASLAPELPELQTLAAFVLTRLGLPEEAISYLRFCKELHPGFRFDGHLSALTRELLGRS